MDVPLRMLHACDLRLGQPIHGIADVPRHLCDVLMDAPYQAARRLVDLAIDEDVDLVLLAGNIIDLRESAPYAIQFLTAQLQRLADHQVQVYWAEGPHDHLDQWPSVIPLPDNVHVFQGHAAERIEHEIDETPVATILGAGHQVTLSEEDLYETESGSLLVVLHCGHLELDPAEAPAGEYWALGGSAHKKVLCESEPTALLGGTTQARSYDDPEACGCHLVTVDPAGEITTTHLATDQVRLLRQRLELASGTSPESLKELLGEQLLSIAASGHDQVLVVNWELGCDGPTYAQLAHDQVINPIQDWLRDEFGHADPSVWVEQIRVDITQSLPVSWTEEESILGDYLRVIQQIHGSKKESLEVSRYVDQPLAQSQPELVAELQPADRDELLRQATTLGVQRLRG